MNVYYELADVSVDPEYGKYFAAYNVRKSTAIGGTEHRVFMANSDRAWAEEDGRVRYLKHRYEDAATAQVDMKEFFWVKLRSMAI